jgi:hypothetical protein
MLIQKQHTVSISSFPQQYHPPKSKQIEATSTTHQHTFFDIPSSVLVAQRVIYSPSCLERLGFYRHRILRTLRTAQTGRDSSSQLDNEVVLQEECVYTWTVVWFGYGIRSSRTRPYGSILPSLTTYPVVPEYSPEIISLIVNGTLFEIQQAFHTGVVHPLTRDEAGQTFFHVGY